MNQKSDGTTSKRSFTAGSFALSSHRKARSHLREWLDQISEDQAGALLDDWSFWARGSQLPPSGDWRIWLFMGGRGAGKTRAGAEWIRSRVESGEARRIGLIGPTLNDVREVMIDGPSGLASIGPVSDRPHYEASRRRLVWPNGACALVFASSEPERLRGPQFDAAWCDEIGAWSHARKSWDMLMLGLRLGSDPRVVATTTPRPTALLLYLVSAKGVVLTRSAMHENAAFLAPGFVDAVEEAYGGTRLCRQEIDGDLIRDPPGALWTRRMIEKYRRPAPPTMMRIVVAVDPPISVGNASDACGIIAAGVAADGACYILADATTRGQRPLEWAGRASALARRYKASSIVAEANQGGEMVREVLTMAGCETHIRLVHAREGKRIRAEPVAALYQQGLVRHTGLFADLEDQMCVFGCAEATGARIGSPDRVDALVWAIWSLALDGRAPRIRQT